MPLSPEQLDRAAGVLVGQACGDALGVPYEFAATPPPGEEPRMVGGGLGPYAPGEYSDDTQMAVCVAQVAATGVDLRDEDALDAVARRFVGWAAGGASDIGIQTRAVLTAAAAAHPHPARALRAAAAALHARTGRSAGNGSLMRTAPVALAYLDRPAEEMAEAAVLVSRLTHHDDLAADACVLWCSGIRRAVLDGSLDGVGDGLGLLPPSRREEWARRLDAAAQGPPTRFRPNRFVVTALQAAWSAVVTTPVPPAAPGDHLRDALHTAVAIGDDTDTVAAVAGALLGARWGADAVPAHWRDAVHGWPGLRAADLARLALDIAAHR